MIIHIGIIFNLSVLISCSFFDFEKRTISLSLFKFFLVGNITIFILEISFTFQNNIYHVLVLKSLIIVIVFSYSFFLYIFKIIGGADGKLFIILFMNHPLIYLNFFTINLFFLLFSIGFIIIHIGQILSNIKSGYEIFFYFVNKDTHNISKIKTIFTLAFYRFSDTKILKINSRKGRIKSNYFIYNAKKREFQLLICNRVPLIPFITLIYFLMIILQVI